MSVIAGHPMALPEHLLAAMARYRHKVFIETLGWELSTRDGRELDQFDRPDTVYVVGSDGQREVNGCARLLPTSQPYLLGEVFPQLMHGLPLPCAADVWELSRFAAVDFNRQSAPAATQGSSAIAVNLLQASIATAAALGARQLITVSPIGIERLLRRAGIRARRAGPPVIIGGHPVVACWIELAPDLV